MAAQLAREARESLTKATPATQTSQSYATQAQAAQAQAPTQPATRHLQLAKPLRLEHISSEVTRSEARMLEELAPIVNNIGLVELDVALTRLAISKPQAELSLASAITNATNVTNATYTTSSINATGNSSTNYGTAIANSSYTRTQPPLSRSSQKRNPNASRNTFFRWGQAHNKRSFALKEDGSAQYMVKMGETIISIVECLLREKHRMFANYEPTYREIRAEVSSLRAANPQIADLDLLQAGQWVTIPAIVVCEALTGQGSLANKSLAS